MSNMQIFFFAAAALCFMIAMKPVTSCAPTRTELFYPNGTSMGYFSPSAGRKRRSADDGKQFEFPVTLNIQTDYKFDQANNEKNADEIEKVLTTINGAQSPLGLIRESTFANHDRKLTSKNGYLRISSTFVQGAFECFELNESYEEVLQSIEKAKEATLVCENETTVIKKIA